MLSGERKASTAEQLMRSRFTAFALADPAYLLKTWHPRTRPDELELDAEKHWYRLDVGRTVQGGIFDDEGIVSFRAFYRHPDGAGEQAEVSRFVKEHGQWFYVAAD